METKVKTHIGSYGIIIKNNKIALIKKARGGYKGKLDLPGGGIEHTELPTDTLKRELLEEANVCVNSYSLFRVHAVNITWQINDTLEEDLHHIGILYLVDTLDSDLKSDADGLDSEGASWYKIDDLRKEDLSPFAYYSLVELGYKIK